MQIDSYQFSEIIIDGEKYTGDVVIFPEHIKSNWRRKQGHVLNIKDLDEVFEKNPEKLIIGTGASGVMDVPEKTREYIKDQGIELVIKQTQEACDYYNQLSSKKDAIVCLHLTC